MRIVTWNINSIRLRLPLLKRMVEELDPDIVCLQETKVEDSSFPLEAVRSLGFAHVSFSGQKSYNGVAVLSKVPLTDVQCKIFGGMEHRRHISVQLAGDVALHNFYVPAGGDIPDVTLNEAYAFKLRFVEEMTTWSESHTRNNQHTIILGDFNIAPLEHDVWSHKQLRNVVSHTEPEITRLNQLQAAGNWCDTARNFVPIEQKLYSWWSYRNHDWRKSDRGRRLDHIWVTPSLKPALKSCAILKDARDWTQPSDHVPVYIDIAI